MRSEEGRGWKSGEGGKEVWKKEEKEKEKSGGKEECLVVGGGSVRGWFRNRKFGKSISFLPFLFFSHSFTAFDVRELLAAMPDNGS